MMTVRAVDESTILEAAHWVAAASAAHVKFVSWGFEDAFTKGEALQAAYVQSLPVWFLRAPHWCYLRRTRFHSKSVELLHESGMLRLPDDRDFLDFTP
ncbi:MAG TPA: hypothetical protein HPP77_01390 [Candidatus Hydrogenedentes bacterium]|nr:hypothetical protein [Candidatus Hydrogenedentota bacterium]